MRLCCRKYENGQNFVGSSFRKPMASKRFQEKTRKLTFFCSSGDAICRFRKQVRRHRPNVHQKGRHRHRQVGCSMAPCFVITLNWDRYLTLLAEGDKRSSSKCISAKNISTPCTCFCNWTDPRPNLLLVSSAGAHKTGNGNKENSVLEQIVST